MGLPCKRSDLLSWLIVPLFLLLLENKSHYMSLCRPKPISLAKCSNIKITKQNNDGEPLAEAQVTDIAIRDTEKHQRKENLLKPVINLPSFMVETWQVCASSAPQGTFWSNWSAKT